MFHANDKSVGLYENFQLTAAHPAPTANNAKRRRNAASEIRACIMAAVKILVLV